MPTKLSDNTVSQTWAGGTFCRHSRLPVLSVLPRFGGLDNRAVHARLVCPSPRCRTTSRSWSMPAC